MPLAIHSPGRLEMRGGPSQETCTYWIIKGMLRGYGCLDLRGPLGFLALWLLLRRFLIPDLDRGPSARRRLFLWKGEKWLRT